MENYRVGLGFDVHRFSKIKKKLVLGGAIISQDYGLEAVSDGDVVLHAVTDALCGACGLGDIGDYFPPENKESKDLDSKKITTFILKKIENNFCLVNMDIIIVSEQPRLISYKNKILNSLQAIFSILSINLKIKSKEGMDILGNKDSMSCLVNVLVKYKKS
ncbi:MAG: 2-C-methyl-D-erythritol 2,4-cyclodiphosphate synthase [Candidatus Omnitrophica bacterium]|nr:2-C-methyl-D-erythritol 2,4-cyclodiphosphate synthase [Candidatus Omnitrophota bacterium]MCK5287603.1 2-C-methyl-D-erythritol 2,4-cyclodiphosphate synthase [Candidatus Omnitrophota bacterium]MCK5393143.1 2-C-methyl-D-erythritol 2,4-cyclodiphosphate synthase [Candidatus Omnitrophota bacterium]